MALLRFYGIRPYRCLMNDTLWLQFLDLQSTLVAYFDTLTDRIIEQALEVTAGEADEQNEAAPQLAPQEHQGALR